ncbi:MAG: hypothetical protein ABFR65_01250 [Pseudomonadota bacterium]
MADKNDKQPLSDRALELVMRDLLGEYHNLWLQAHSIENASVIGTLSTDDPKLDTNSRHHSGSVETSNLKSVHKLDS